MPPAEATRRANRLIEALPRALKPAFLKHCTPVSLTFAERLCESGERYRHVYFPLTGFVSLVATVSGHPPLEVGLIGNEGMLGATLILGSAAAPLRGVVQGEGTALRMNLSAFQGHLAASPGLTTSLKNYLFVLTAQLAQSAPCTRFHETEPRLARWLLMSHDRSSADSFHFTHQFLADMLGVLRSAITIAAGALQRRGLISYVRGEISVLDRKGLEMAACECYGRFSRR